jgi:hypothetical protein
MTAAAHVTAAAMSATAKATAVTAAATSAMAAPGGPCHTIAAERSRTGQHEGRRKSPCLSLAQGYLVHGSIVRGSIVHEVTSVFIGAVDVSTALVIAG